MVAEQCELFITSPLQDIRRKLYALLRRLGGSKKDIGAAYRSIIYNINGHHDSKNYKKTWSFCHYYVCMLLSRNRPTWFLRCLYYPASTTVTTEGGLKMPAPTSYISILKKKKFRQLFSRHLTVQESKLPYVSLGTVMALSLARRVDF